jgi:NDP-sugar pyrophosphorylase family protein
MKHFLIDESIVVNGDTFIEANLENFLIPLNLLGGELIRMGVVNVEDRSRFGGVEVNEKKKVISFFDKDTLPVLASSF